MKGEKRNINFVITFCNICFFFPYLHVLYISTNKGIQKHVHKEKILDLIYQYILKEELFKTMRLSTYMLH